MSTGHILGEGTMLTALDQQMALSGKVPKSDSSLTSNILILRQISRHSNIEGSKAIPRTTNKIEDKYPDLYLPVAENYKKATNSMGIQTVCLQIIIP